ncbi:MAG: cobalamin-dependent protein [Candidatus Aminicenantes bacterium]|nr:cobalamin-dependent protein [Candidatus Aminicenantes bacterium]
MKPLGLLYVASLLKQYSNLSVHFIDCLDRYHPLLPKKSKTKNDGRGSITKEESKKPEVLMDIPRKFSRYGLPLDVFRDEIRRTPLPDAVFLSCTMTYWYPGVQAVIEEIRRTWGRIPVLLGGIYPTLIPDHAASQSGADVIIRGPAEQFFPEVLKRILGDAAAPISEKPSTELPQPAFELLRSKEVLPLITSRGCPFRCSFCAGPLLYPGFNQRPLGSVADELEKDLRIHGAKHIAFYDDALLINKENHFFPLLDEIVRRGLNLSFHTPNGLHVREIDVPTAGMMKKAGFQSLFLSQESFDSGVLAGACSKVEPADLDEALNHLDKAGYIRSEVNVYLLVGLPGIHASVVKEDIRRVRKLGARPRLAYFSPVPGTVEWRKLVEKGIFAEDTDPLLHNKLAFAYIWGDITPEEFESLTVL